MPCMGSWWLAAKTAATTWSTHIKNYSLECKAYELDLYVLTNIYLKNVAFKTIYIAILTEHLMCNYSEDFTSIRSFNIQNYSLKWTLLLFPFTDKKLKHREMKQRSQSHSPVSPESVLLVALLN